MAKQASALTKAIRQLCVETDGEITHAESRVKLPAMGHKVCPEPKRKSAEYAQWEEWEVDYSDKESIAVTAEECGFDDATTKAVIKEHKMRVAFDAERNNFNVTKYNWGKARASGKASPSEKPADAKNTKSRTAAKVGKVDPSVDPIDFVESNGGLAKCKAKLAELKGKQEKIAAEIAKKQQRLDAVEVEAAALKAVIDEFAKLSKRLKAAA
jgi:hypothetical protein